MRCKAPAIEQNEIVMCRAFRRVPAWRPTTFKVGHGARQSRGVWTGDRAFDEFTNLSIEQIEPKLFADVKY